MSLLKRYFHQKQVLVTGGAGFIGSHLVEKLVEFGAYVTVFDNLSTGSIANLELVNKEILFVKGDVCQKNEVEYLFSLANYNYVFHCAAFVSVAESSKNPELCYAINHQGTKNLLEQMSYDEQKVFILSSTAAVYGNHEGIAYERTPVQPLSPYAESKISAEHAVQDAVTYSMIDGGVVLRYFNVYGERQNAKGDYASVIPRFRQALMQEEPITIFGDGNQTRDFVSVETVVEANLIAAAVMQQGYLVCNVASGTSVTLHEVLQRLEQETEKNIAELIYKPAREGEVRHSEASVEKLQMMKTFFYTIMEADTTELCSFASPTLAQKDY